MAVFEEVNYSNHNFTDIPLVIGEYEDCRFINCNFEAANLSNDVFI